MGTLYGNHHHFPSEVNTPGLFARIRLHSHCNIWCTFCAGSVVRTVACPSEAAEQMARGFLLSFTLSVLLYYIYLSFGLTLTLTLFAALVTLITSMATTSSCRTVSRVLEGYVCHKRKPQNEFLVRN